MACCAQPMSLVRVVMYCYGALFLAIGAVPPYVPENGIMDSQAFEQWLATNSQTFDVLTVHPGTYRVTNLTSDSYHLRFTQPLSNLIIDFSDVTLVMSHRSNTAAMISNWVNVTLQGLTIEYAEIPTNQAIITAFSASGEYMDVEVAPGFPLDDW